MLKIERKEYGIVWSLYSGGNLDQPHCWGVTYMPNTAGHGSGSAMLGGRDVAKHDGYAWSWTRRMFMVIDTAGICAGGDEEAGVAIVLEPGGEWVR